MSAGDDVVYRSTSGDASGENPFAQLKAAFNDQRGRGAARRGGRAPVRKAGGQNRERYPVKCGQSEEDVFRTAMDGVREIPEFRGLAIPIRGEREPACPPRANNTDVRDLQRVIDGDAGLDLSLTAEYVEWRRGDQPRDLARRLHRGDFSVQETLDLHGMIREEALGELGRFLKDIRRRGLYCVKVIHGRGLRSPGEPVLRSAVREWLARGPYRKRVRAFSTAQGRDGGLGALYILLQK